VPVKAIHRRSPSDGRVFLGGQGLAGEHRFVDLQRRALREPEIARHAITGREHRDVPRHELPRGDRSHHRIANDLGGRRLDRTEGFECPRRPSFLHDADGGVQQDDRKNGNGVEPLAEPDPGNHRRDD
jgi:hypothetical protein